MKIFPIFLVAILAFTILVFAKSDDFSEKSKKVEEWLCSNTKDLFKEPDCQKYKVLDDNDIGDLTKSDDVYLARISINGKEYWMQSSKDNINKIKNKTKEVKGVECFGNICIGG